MYCPHCGKEVSGNESFCPYCGADLRNNASHVANQAIYNTNSEYSSKSWLVTLLLLIFLGGLGIHRFYVGKIGTGILWLFTAGLFGIGCIIDLIMVVTMNFTDSEDKKIDFKHDSVLNN